MQLRPHAEIAFTICSYRGSSHQFLAKTKEGRPEDNLCH